MESKDVSISSPYFLDSDIILGGTTSYVNSSVPSVPQIETTEMLAQHHQAQVNDVSELSPTGPTQFSATQPTPLLSESIPTESNAKQDSHVSTPIQPSNEQNTVPAPTVHQHTYTAIVTDASCLEKGYTAQTCTSCSYSFIEKPTGAIGHHYITVVTAPTCTSKGYSVHTCSRCSNTYTDGEIAATGHIWNQWTVITAPTKNTYGQQSRTCSACSKTETHGIPPLQPSTNELQQEVLRLVNIERQNAGLPPLSYCYEAQEAADMRVSEIQISFSHTRPNGKQCYTVASECGIDVSISGENIAFGFPSPETIVSKWMESPGHRANILEKNITGLVVGVSGSYWVQLFIK